jgi:hypothetical protein
LSTLGSFARHGSHHGHTVDFAAALRRRWAAAWLRSARPRGLGGRRSRVSGRRGAYDAPAVLHLAMPSGERLSGSPWSGEGLRERGWMLAARVGWNRDLALRASSSLMLTSRRVDGCFAISIRDRLGARERSEAVHGDSEGRRSAACCAASRCSRARPGWMWRGLGKLIVRDHDPAGLRLPMGHGGPHVSEPAGRGPTRARGCDPGN